MSQESVNGYLRFQAAWNSGDLDGYLAQASPGFEFRTSNVFPDLKPAYRGIEGARQLWTDMRGPWEEIRITIERIEDLGEVVVALITFKVRGRDGLMTSRRWAHVVEDENGKATVIENYESWDKALKAVGLEE